jgi:hypothetical protein
MRTTAVLLATLALLTACRDQTAPQGSAARPSPTPQATQSPTPYPSLPAVVRRVRERAREFGRADNVYISAFSACASFSPEDLADYFRASSTKPSELAAAFSEGYAGKEYDAAYAGCLYGVRVAKKAELEGDQLEG